MIMTFKKDSNWNSFLNVKNKLNCIPAFFLVRLPMDGDLPWCSQRMVPTPAALASPEN